LLRPPPPVSTLFPYTTLFRSLRALPDVDRDRRGCPDGHRDDRGGVVETEPQDAEDAVDEPGDREQEEHPGVEQVLTDLGEPHDRSEEHTSELQSRENLVCRLL